MTFVILCAVFGLLIGFATIFVPRLIALRKNHPYDDADSRAYLKETGRSAEGIAQSGHGQPQDEAASRKGGGTGSAGAS
jgi:hypothetical protein